MSRDTEMGVSLYSRKVLIKNKTDNILPKWLRFVKGKFCPGYAIEQVTSHRTLTDGVQACLHGIYGGQVYLCHVFLQALGLYPAVNDCSIASYSSVSRRRWHVSPRLTPQTEDDSVMYSHDMYATLNT